MGLFDKICSSTVYCAENNGCRPFGTAGVPGVTCVLVKQLNVSRYPTFGDSRIADQAVPRLTTSTDPMQQLHGIMYTTQNEKVTGGSPANNFNYTCSRSFTGTPTGADAFGVFRLNESYGAQDIIGNTANPSALNGSANAASYSVANGGSAGTWSLAFSGTYDSVAFVTSLYTAAAALISGGVFTALGYALSQGGGASNWQAGYTFRDINSNFNNPTDGTALDLSGTSHPYSYFDGSVIADPSLPGSGVPDDGSILFSAIALQVYGNGSYGFLTAARVQVPQACTYALVTYLIIAHDDLDGLDLVPFTGGSTGNPCAQGTLAANTDFDIPIPPIVDGSGNSLLPSSLFESSSRPAGFVTFFIPFCDCGTWTEADPYDT